MSRVRGRWWLPGAVLVLAIALVLGVMIGPAGNWGTANWDIVWKVRMPRVVLAGIVGAMLSLSGASFQGVFRNPLVDPYLLGVAAGAGLGATIVFAVGRSATSGWWVDPLPLAAFVGGLAAVLLTYVVGASFGGGRGDVTLVLAGVAITSLATAIQAFVLQRNSDVIREVYSWILGRLTNARWGDVRLVLPYVAGEQRRAPVAPAPPRRAARRRRRGPCARHSRRAGPARRRRRRDARHRSGRQRQRADRLRRHRRAARRPNARGRVATAACCRSRWWSAQRS